ncbi:hypothetical protein NDU88_009123 [Pleurodeles waltl]|uniref:Uncharacterized protein n=1 Tax=Pleurodeles waltl TaxID=8319 RepID=A0AAV7PYL6_PLEWA|nr:hypothetical protein NDU88_009123 [Pleurodeles waltl]
MVLLWRQPGRSLPMHPRTQPRSRRGVALADVEPSKVVQALKVLHDEGREDLLREGVLEQAWVGFRRPKRLSSEGVTSATIACASPAHTPYKFRNKSVFGRKLNLSPECCIGGALEVSKALPVVQKHVQRGAAKFARRSGTSFQQHVVSRGASWHSAVMGLGRLGARPGGTLEFSGKRALKRGRYQALTTLENSGERREPALEERHLGDASKMVAPTDTSQDSIVIISDDEVLPDPAGDEKKWAESLWNFYGQNPFVTMRKTEEEEDPRGGAQDLTERTRTAKEDTKRRTSPYQLRRSNERTYQMVLLWRQPGRSLPMHPWTQPCSSRGVALAGAYKAAGLESVGGGQV